jgi:hypothetical protein
MMASEFAKAPAESAGEAGVAKVNTEDPPQITAQFRIADIPAFARTQNGKPTAQTSGFQSASQPEFRRCSKPRSFAMVTAANCSRRLPRQMNLQIQNHRWTRINTDAQAVGAKNSFIQRVNAQICANLCESVCIWGSPSTHRGFQDEKSGWIQARGGAAPRYVKKGRNCLQPSRGTERMFRK